MPKKKQPRKPRLRRVSVRADHRDKPDWDRFAWALLQHTRTLSKPRPEPKRQKGPAGK